MYSGVPGENLLLVHGVGLRALAAVVGEIQGVHAEHDGVVHPYPLYPVRAPESRRGREDARPLRLGHVRREALELREALVHIRGYLLRPLRHAAGPGHYPKRALEVLAEERPLFEGEAGYARLALEPVRDVRRRRAEDDVRPGQDYRLAVVGGVSRGIRPPRTLLSAQASRVT